MPATDPPDTPPRTAPDDEAPRPGMSTTGKVTVMAIIGLAVVLGLLNFAYQQRRTARSVAYWGPAHRALIVGEQVEVMLLEEAGTAADDDQLLRVGQRQYRVSQHKDGDGVRGLLHVRRALLDDGAYRWEQPPPEQAPVYRYAIRFASQGAEPPPQAGPAAVVLFNRDGSWVQGQDSPRPLAVRNNEQGLPPFAAFLAEQFAEEEVADHAAND